MKNLSRGRYSFPVLFSRSMAMAAKSVSLLGGVQFRPIVHRLVPSSNVFTSSTMATMATYKVPKVENENNVSLSQSIEAIG